MQTNQYKKGKQKSDKRKASPNRNRNRNTKKKKKKKNGCKCCNNGYSHYKSIFSNSIFFQNPQTFAPRPNRSSSLHSPRFLLQNQSTLRRNLPTSEAVFVGGLNRLLSSRRRNQTEFLRRLQRRRSGVCGGTSPLSRFLQNPKIEEDIKQLLPERDSSYADDAVQLSVRASFFDCGGVAVGVCFSHRIGDLLSLVAFMNAWAAACRGEEVSGSFRPSFDLSRHFPPRSGSGSQSSFGLCLGVTREKFMTKRLVFDREKVEKLKKKGSSEKKKDPPSRVEAVSAFLWRSYVAAYKATRETSSFPASHMVGVRARAVPPLPPHTFGNCFTFATAVATSDEDDSDSDLLVSKLRAAIRGVDGGYFDSDDKINRSVNELFQSENCIFSSWLRAPVYEVDFGWGKPVRICTTGMPYMNLVVLMDTPCGDGGVEAWINVPDDRFFHLLQANYSKEFHTVSN